MRPSSPSQALAELIELFPGFREEWETYTDDADPTYHSVMSTFAQFFGPATGSPKQVARLGAWLSEAVEVEDDLENAASTCFLEHVHQIKVGKLLKPHLSARARERTHA